MAQERVASKLVNKVRFDVNQASLKKSLKAIEKFKKKFASLKDATQGMSVSMSIKDSRQVIQKAKKANTAVVKDKVQKERQALTEQEALERRITKRSIAKELRERQSARKALAARESRITTRRLQVGELQGTLGIKPAEMKKASEMLENIHNRYRKGSMSAAQYSQETGAVIRNLKRQNKATKSLTSSMREMRTVLVALTASYTAFSAAVDIADVGKQFQNLEIGMGAAFGPETRSNLTFLAKEADRVGVRMLDLSKDYIKFAVAAQATGVEVDTLRDTFSGMLESSRVFGLSSENTSLALRAITQSFNKAQVMAEEFKLQFGEIAALHRNM